MNASNSTPETQRAPGILIVDDTPINLQLLSAMLTQRGYRPRPVTSGRAAIAAAEAEKPDLILLDVSMPQMNGYETCERIKAIPALNDVPVLFLSALSQMEDKIRAFKAGGVDYITKPFLIEEIEARISAHLRVAQQAREVQRHRALLEEAVEARTSELNKAYSALQSMDKMKREFLLLLSHEMRTPSNGLLGITDHILELCPDTPERDEWKRIYAHSKERLIAMLDESRYLFDLEQTPEVDFADGCPVSWLWTELGRLQGMEPRGGAVPASAKLACKPEELTQLLLRLSLLAAIFPAGPEAGKPYVDVDDKLVVLGIPLGGLTLGESECAEFFSIGSTARTMSKAEPLGLSPVVAKRIVERCGGTLRMTRGEGRSGKLVVALRWKA